ncbi:ABC transporter permease [Kitasatospora sp. NPDC058170]|uniref:ABC transporter permease n=1 Tax=Kitasatospora sp. NPDC058170 TaxID=3346364 RepID=UPI0036DBE024
MLRAALRNVLAHRGRLLMTACSVIIGTAFLAGTLIFSDTARRAAENSRSTDYSQLSVLVTDQAAGAFVSPRQKSERGSTALTDTTVRQLAALPGTARVRPVVTSFTAVADRDGDLLGEAELARGTNFLPGPDGRDDRYPIVEGRGPQGAGEIALDRAAAWKGGYRVGDTVRLSAGGPVFEARLVGVFSTDDPVVSAGGTLVLLETAEAQRTLLAPGQYSGIEVTARAGVSEDSLLSQVKPLVPAEKQFSADTAQELSDDQATRLAEGTQGTRTVLLSFAGISLFVGAFIIANTFTMLIAQRTRELALMRAVGAGRWQVTGSVLAEALVIGGGSSAIGLLAGVGIGAGLRALFASLYPDLPTGPLVITASSAAAAVAVGTLTTMLSALLPALRAARIAPVAAMGSGAQPEAGRSLRLRNALGVLSTLAGAALVLRGAGGKGMPSQFWVDLGALPATVGVLLLLPLLSRPVVALARPVLARLFGTPGRLAALNVLRSPRRTAATAAALTIGLTLITGLTVLGSSVATALDEAVTADMKADYAVRMNNNSLSPQLVDRISAAPGVAAAGAVSSVYWQVDGGPETVQGFDPDTVDRLVQLTMLSGSTEALRRGQILVSAEYAADEGVSVGSDLQVGRPGGPTVPVTVGGVFETSRMLESLLLSNAEIARHQPEAYINHILVKGVDGATAALRQSIRDATGNNPVLEIQSKQDLRDGFNDTISVALKILYALLGVALVIAALGVVNTLTMAVFERRREIGMLRAVGLERGGIRQMVRLESVVVSLFGAATGMALGSLLAWASIRTLLVKGEDVTPVLPYGELMLMLVLAALVGMAAALWPARRAAGLDVLAAIGSE